MKKLLLMAAIPATLLLAQDSLITLADSGTDARTTTPTHATAPVRSVLPLRIQVATTLSILLHLM